MRAPWTLEAEPTANALKIYSLRKNLDLRPKFPPLVGESLGLN